MNVICLTVGSIGTNCYLVYDDRKTGVVIDPGGEAPRIVGEIQKNGLHIEHILITHVHFDHILAAEDVLKATGADFLVPRDDEAALTDPKRNLTEFTGGSRRFPKADCVLDDGEEIAAGALRFKVLHTPGHTKGSCCFLCGDTLFSGDTIFAGSVGRTDFPGGDPDAVFHSAKRLSKLEGDYTVLPGHGPGTTLDAERRRNPYMQENIDDFTD